MYTVSFGIGSAGLELQMCYINGTRYQILVTEERKNRVEPNLAGTSQWKNDIHNRKENYKYIQQLFTVK